MACTLDFRCLDEGLGGQRNKRKRSPEPSDDPIHAAVDSMDLDRPSKRSAVPSSGDPDKPVFGKPTYDGVIAGKVSGRKWKQARQQRASAVRVRRGVPSFEARAKEKELKRAYKERMGELKEEIRANKAEKRRKREEREKRKQENVLMSGTKFQVISNPKTLKKIQKTKQRKLLRRVPDEVVNRNKKKEEVVVEEK
ncbi:hypothetical protein QJS04_geneDACA004370 [Acorus gramineus]|uniref:Coiled-coil domain-containing protein 86 n=1 Tax=Acorus gramineus TaxID=55184 RepID=A0AAV9B6X4_ACOGR|nr:hypothetical protein QJS04_geneDACA004370 [Acorus gramineus]